MCRNAFDKQPYHVSFADLMVLPLLTSPSVQPEGTPSQFRGCLAEGFGDRRRRRPRTRAIKMPVDTDGRRYRLMSKVLLYDGQRDTLRDHPRRARVAQVG